MNKNQEQLRQGSEPGQAGRVLLQFENRARRPMKQRFTPDVSPIPPFPPVPAREPVLEQPSAEPLVAETKLEFPFEPPLIDRRTLAEGTSAVESNSSVLIVEVRSSIRFEPGQEGQLPIAIDASGRELFLEMDYRFSIEDPGDHTTS